MFVQKFNFVVFVFFCAFLRLHCQEVQFVDTKEPETNLEKPNNSASISPVEEIALGANQTGQENRGVLEWIFGILGGSTEAPLPVSPPEDCTPCICGITNTRIRIVGGQETRENEYPWMTLLMYEGRFYCGASLISDKYLLTAGHCVHNFQKERISATFLVHDRLNPDKTKTFSRKISQVFKHRRYDPRNYNNDIAVLRLAERVLLVDPLRPVCLPPVGKSFTGLIGVVTGWGATGQSGSLAMKLREVNVPIMSNKDCRKTAYGPDRITDNMLCAGYPEGMKDSCQGDSGGPLHIINNTQHFEVGVVSWGEGCAERNRPGVYTRVNRYISWITERTKDSCFCQTTK